MSTDNTPEGLREAVEALAEKWAAVLVECKEVDPRWILDRSVTTLETALTDLRAILAEHPATPAEVERMRKRGDLNADGLVAPAEPDAGDVGGLRDLIAQAPSLGYDYDPDAITELILASDWLATRTRMAAEAGEKRGAEKALREAADDWAGGPTGEAPIPRWWLRDRADRIGGE